MRPCPNCGMSTQNLACEHHIYSPDAIRHATVGQPETLRYVAAPVAPAPSKCVIQNGRCIYCGSTAREIEATGDECLNPHLHPPLPPSAATTDIYASTEPQCDTYTELYKPESNIKLTLNCVLAIGHNGPHAFAVPFESQFKRVAALSPAPVATPMESFHTPLSEKAKETMTDFERDYPWGSVYVPRDATEIEYGARMYQMGRQQVRDEAPVATEETAQARQFLADEILKRIAERYKNCSINIYPDFPELSPVEAVLRCALEEGFVLRLAATPPQPAGTPQERK